ncbi:MAG: ATP-binding protein, partial [Flavobacteriales bacterium]
MFYLRFSLRQRIYFSMLMLILLSFVFTGITAFYNFKLENERYNEERLERKEGALQTSMEYFLEQQGGTVEPDSLALRFSSVIVELADVHRLSVNLYDLKGNLLISSTEERFDNLGFDIEMDYTVLKQLSTGTERPAIEKTIDDQEFYLVYWYLTDFYNRKIAIVNVKYDKKNIDDGELRRFLAQLTQIYILLFLGAAFLAYFLSNYITKSLQKIGSKMKVIDLSKANDPIEWQGNDEIGTLVKQYNRMLGQVKNSAQMLAKSERESAWREMAKQVAHEIKNPLTPMKLRVQHLQRSLSNDPNTAQEQIDKFAVTMIDQIDTLSSIATEFSHFAKMPRAVNEKLDLINIIKGVQELFSTTPNCTIHFTISAKAPALVYADKDQLSRVLNNLVNNAIQAIEDAPHGKIQVVLREEESSYLMTVEDNGTGISDEL